MKNEIIGLLYNEYVNTVNDCNDFGEVFGYTTRFNVDWIPENFLSDVLALALTPITIYKEVSPEECDRLCYLLEDFNTNLDIDMANNALEIVRNSPFKIPDTLNMLVFRSKLLIIGADDESKNEVIDSELDLIDTVLCIYADIMCFVTEVLSEDEKQIIFDFLQQCCNYVTQELRITFNLSQDVINIINNN